MPEDDKTIEQVFVTVLVKFEDGEQETVGYEMPGYVRNRILQHREESQYFAISVTEFIAEQIRMAMGDRYKIYIQPSPPR